MSPQLAINYKMAPTVERFHDSNAFVRAIVGPVGSGKSSGSVMEGLFRATQQAPGIDGVRRTRGLIVRNTYRELADTTRKTFESWIPAALGTWREKDFVFTMRLPLDDGTKVECEILFRSLDSPDDVGKLLSLELTWAYINEGREVPKEILDVLTTRVGRFPAMKDGGPTWFGVWMDSNPWAETSEHFELFNKSLPEGFQLFEQPSGLAPNAENISNLVPGYYERLCAGKDQEWIDEYIRSIYPKADKGSIYGDLIAKLRGRGGVSDFEHPTDGCFVNLDLGVSDATAIWWWRLGANGMPDIVDWYENSGKGMSHYFEVIDGKCPEGVDRPRKYDVHKVWLPHDGAKREFQTGVSTLSQFQEHFGSGAVAIGPQLPRKEGIAAARWLLEQSIRIHSRCEPGLKRLAAYKYVWDPVKMVFSKEPLHDWTSHTADDFRYVACVVKATEMLMRPEAPPERITQKPPTNIEEIFNQHFEQVANQRRRY